MITSAVARLYINTYAIRDIDGSEPPSMMDPARLRFISIGTESALTIISTALRSEMFQGSLFFTVVSEPHSNV